ncbi:disulfide-isomerase TMX3-like protein [Sarcoptes scabiei]|uniref:Disulfide-isomerase TMX3-like protein n=1 Tax=Sarcoptes scabiei TaxID=52283 RepID=A0A132A414_SARSC|nr:disulfide-isomerase TMX3-like protein [Sarcoptes scabiei]
MYQCNRWICRHSVFLIWILITLGVQNFSFLNRKVVSKSWKNLGMVEASRVIEMNDRLIDIYLNDKRSFLVKFYIPWCHHCQELDPIWSQVAQQLTNIDPNIVVGRVDCAKHSNVATHFGIRGFPTIIYLNSQKRVEFKGDRTREEIIDFAIRINGPPIRYLSSCDQLKDFFNGGHRVIFINFGSDADDYEQHGNLSSWIRRHRFPHFSRFSSTNLYMALQSQKSLVILTIDEPKNSAKFVNKKNEALVNQMEIIAYSYSDSKDNYLFGYTSDRSTLNSLAIRSIEPLPNLIVLNSSDLRYCLMTDNLNGKFDIDRLKTFLELISNKANDLKLFNSEIRFTFQYCLIYFRLNLIFELNSILFQCYGGDTYPYRFARLGFDFVTTLVGMYHGNPVLTILLFGLPSSFLAIIIYMSCGSDLLDSRDEDETFEDEDDDTLGNFFFFFLE